MVADKLYQYDAQVDANVYFDDGKGQFSLVHAAANGRSLKPNADTFNSASGHAVSS